MTTGHLIQDVPRVDVPTREGTAQLRVIPPPPGAQRRAGTLLLGHGAGGQRDAADVLTLTALVEDGWTVVLVDQPWRVAGRKVAPRPATLDAAFEDIVRVASDPAWQSQQGVALPAPWVLGGRSAGARVACRMSVAVSGTDRSREVRAHEQVAGVLCLAFPLHPPGKPERSRADELALPVEAGLPTLVIQGTSDPFGSPAEVTTAVQGATLTIHEVPGNHSPSRDLEAVLQHARAFLTSLTG